MFKAPFSFEGRIRRLEFGLSLIIYYVIFFLIGFIYDFSEAPFVKFLGTIVFLGDIWFSLSQGTKRCHDLGNSGWFMLIPLYGLWMLFQNSDPGENKYGMNPKGIGNGDAYDDEINEIGKSLES
ncbi:DUF805 domain-containing protein [Emticicia sp. TH156]|uniref:DUF805 domain-containing protein n=1 Tax=Emticicia sp. TH156 TaxID=2067454 RepID=UPI000C765EF7|nr:DUF805 domain-containing protein [Emticicia sp. TH156]PLK45481.1 DUF805 domain-containing protein [Emticicia sp. TH156]